MRFESLLQLSPRPDASHHRYPMRLESSGQKRKNVVATSWILDRLDSSEPLSILRGNSRPGAAKRLQLLFSNCMVEREPAFNLMFQTRFPPFWATQRECDQNPVVRGLPAAASLHDSILLPRKEGWPNNALVVLKNTEFLTEKSIDITA